MQSIEHKLRELRKFTPEFDRVYLRNPRKFYFKIIYLVTENVAPSSLRPKINFSSRASHPTAA